MPATAAGTRPRSSRGGSARSNLAYDLGHSGEPMPSWVEDNDEHREAYLDGAADASAGDDTRGRRDPTRRRATSPRKNATVTPITAAPSRSNGATPPATARDTWYEPAPSGRTFSPSGASGVVVTAGDSVGSVIFGVITYAVLINAVDGGWAGVKSWLSAKFTNGGGQLP